MTREEAIEVIKAYRDKLTHSVSNQLDGDIEAFDMAIEALEQEPKTGHWICIDDYHIGKFKCSVCQTEGFPNTAMYEPTWNYCPNCGAKMKEGDA